MRRCNFWKFLDVFKLHGRVIRFKNVRKSELIVANYELLCSVLMNFSDNALYSSDKKMMLKLRFRMLEKKFEFRYEIMARSFRFDLASNQKSKIIGQFRRVRVRKVPAWVYLLHKVLRLQWVQKLVLFGIATAAHFISI